MLYLLRFTLLPSLLLAFAGHAHAQTAKLDLRKGDRVVFMGDTFAEREALFGYIETMLHAQFPEHKLTFRNLAYSADTPKVLLADLEGTHEYNHGSNRALNFGTMTQHLTDVKADVIILCLGMAASLEHKGKVDEFAKDLEALLKAYGDKQFNGKSPPRFVLVGPIAHENTNVSPPLTKGGPGGVADPGEHNDKLDFINEAMKRVAASKGIPFVDLYTPSRKLMEKNPGERFTFNGIHLTQYGYWAVAQLLIEQLGMHVPQLTIQTATLHRRPLCWEIFHQDNRLPPPPAPSQAKIHPQLLDRQYWVQIKEMTIPKALLEIDGKQWASFSDEQAQKRAHFMSSPHHLAAEKLRRAVVARNTEFFFKFRAVNGEYVYGRRAKPFGVVNFPGEMRKLDEISEVLGKVIHSLSRCEPMNWATLERTNKDVKTWVNLPEQPCPSTDQVYNQSQGIINGKEVLTAKDPDEARKLFKLADGYEINLFASEKDFPLHNPIAMAFDAKGRLWVTTMPSYPHALPGSPPNDKVLILEDTKGAGKADKCTVFADGLYLPTGIEFGEGGVYVGAQPNLMFLKDTNGDDVADTREVILHGFGSGDSHHAVHAFTRTPEGALLFHEGIFHRSNVETPHGVMRQHDAAIWRFQPKSHKLDLYVSYNFANPWGHVFDKWGFNFIADASGGANYNALPLTGHVEFPRQHPSMKVFTQPIIRPTCGCELVSSRQFPPEAQGNFLFNNNIGFQGIKQFKVIEEGSGFTSKELEPLLVSRDPNFRPVALKFGPDGALYVVDWYNPLIGHMQHSIRDPGRDHYHGRIWRITAKGRPLVKAPKIAGLKPAKLFELLDEPESLTRYLVRGELRDRKREDVIPGLNTWILILGSEASEQNEHLLLEALWIQQSHNALNPDLLRRLLRAKDYRARAAATRLLRDWRGELPSSGKEHEAFSNSKLEFSNGMFDRFAQGRGYFFASDASLMRGPLYDFVEANGIADGKITREQYLGFQLYVKYQRLGGGEYPGALQLLEDQINDVHPRVRLEAVVALSFFKTPRAAEIALDVLKHPRDYYLDYALKETMTTLEPYWKPMLAEVRPFAANNPAGVRYVLAGVSNEDLLRMPPSEAVCLAFLARPGVAADQRNGVLAILARLRKSQPLEQLIKLIEDIDAGHAKPHAVADHAGHVLHDLGGLFLLQSAKELQSVRPRLQKLALEGQQSTTRRVAIIALITADGSREAIGKLSESSLTVLHDLLAAVPLLPDGKRRTEMYGDAVRALTIADTVKLPREIASGLRGSAMEALAAMPGLEVDTVPLLANLYRGGKDPDAAIRALRQIPKAKWPQKEIRSLIDSIIGNLKKLPAKDRTEISALDALQLGNDLAALLPADQAKVVRAQLAEVGVNVVLVRTIPHLMLYDRQKFYVEAGKPVVILLDNNDIMPHNLVITVPGSLAEIGLAAEKLASDPAFQAKGYVPPGKKVLHATRMLQPREADRITFIAPTTPGQYVYVCTFPGHWRVMNGIMHVVPKLADVPPEELTPPKTVVAETRPFVRNWTVEELTPDLINLDKPRSFTRGKELFKAASCIQCHAMNKEGGELGPDLVETSKKLAALKMSKIELLREVFDPSRVILDPYKPRTFITTNGQVVSGLVIARDKEMVRVGNNPREKPKEIKVADIDEESESKISIMPNGLLVTLQREEIYDLLAYIVAGGDGNHPLYRRKE